MIEFILNAMKSSARHLSSALSSKPRHYKITPKEQIIMHKQIQLGWTKAQIEALQAFQPEIDCFLADINA